MYNTFFNQIKNLLANFENDNIVDQIEQILNEWYNLSDDAQRELDHREEIIINLQAGLHQMRTEFDNLEDDLG